jgi:isopentenyl diphosphate isomerase/L-lactate dehydrogenase-like FMN-dependent dehydrogenase
MTYDEVLENARKVMAPKCRVCKECNGVACRGEIPGLGGRGDGRSFTVCRDFFKSVKIEMDTVHEEFEPDLSVEMFGKKFDVPFFAAPIGGMSFNYTNYMTEEEYSDAIVNGCREAGTLPWTGDGPKDDYFSSTLPYIKAAGGVAISTMKPWTKEKVMNQIEMLKETGAIGWSMDIDSAAHQNLKLMGKPVETKTVEQLREFAQAAGIPFVVKGIMTAKAALKCKEAGAYGIVVSSHGGRVMEDNPCPASLVEEIRAACGNNFKIIVDGGIRTGGDVFKCIALGADAVLIGRPFSVAAHGGRAEGVKLYVQKIKEELREIMIMSDCRSISEITRDKIRF